jgi:hypothetical protein
MAAALSQPKSPFRIASSMIHLNIHITYLNTMRSNRLPIICIHIYKYIYVYIYIHIQVWVLRLLLWQQPYLNQKVPFVLPPQ